MPNKDYYQSVFAGKQIDEAIGKIINGEVEKAVQRAEIAATEAEKSELSATRSASAAAQSQNNSKTSETNSEKSAVESEKSRKLSESWAVGGTGVREGEDTNNAKFWAEQSHNATAGGVSSFNGRAGFVMPQEGDYTPEMVGASPASLIDRVLLHEYMMTYNDFVAPLATDDSVLTVIVEDENNAILANWKYKEV